MAAGAAAFGYHCNLCALAGKPGDAVREFSRAAKAYPWWGRVQLKWGEALAESGKADAAKARFALAARLELTPAERVELARVSR
jgi:hypothetical protein